MPPEKVPASRCASPLRATAASASSTRASRSRRGTSYTRANSETFSRPVSPASAESCWGT